MSSNVEAAFTPEVQHAGMTADSRKPNVTTESLGEFPAPAHMPAKLLAFAGMRFENTANISNPQNKEAPALTPASPESKEELSIETALERFKAVVLRIDLDDAVKRLEKVFPMTPQKSKLLRRKISLCSSVAEVVALNEEFMANLGDYLDQKYSDDDLNKLRSYINKVRDSADLEKLCDMAYWMVAASASRKTGCGHGWKDKSDLPQRLKTLKTAMEKDFAAIYDGGGTNHIMARRLKPVYSNLLTSRYTDSGKASEHVMAVGLNAAANLMNVLGFYNYKHQTGDQDKGLKWNPLMWQAFLAEVFCDDGWKAEFSASIDRIDQLCAELTKAVNNWINNYELPVSRTQTVDDVITEHEKRVEVLVKKQEKYRNLIKAEFAGVHAMFEKFGDIDAVIGWDADQWFDKYLDHTKQNLRHVLIEIFQDASVRFICDRKKKDSVGKGKEVLQKFTYLVSSDNPHLNQLKYIRLLLRGMSPGLGGGKNDYLSNPEIFRQYRFSFEGPILDKLTKDFAVQRGAIHLDRLDVEKLLLEGDADIYRGCDDPPHVMAPPSASGYKTVRVEVASGCNHAACTFCEMRERPGKKKFSAVTPEEFKTQIELIKEFNQGQEIYRKNRIFLGNGNAFALHADQLVEMMNMLRADEYFREILRTKNRIECYARARDVCTKSDDDLARLKKAGLSLVYLGLESGSDEVLKLVNKGQTRAEFIEAVQRLRAAGIDASVMVMPGLGGKKHAGAHTQETAEALAQTLARFAVFLPLDCPPGRKYAKDIAADPENADLTPAEIQEQVRAIRDEFKKLAAQNPALRHVDKVRLAAHDPNITPIAGSQPEVFELRIKG